MSNKTQKVIDHFFKARETQKPSAQFDPDSTKEVLTLIQEESCSTSTRTSTSVELQVTAKTFQPDRSFKFPETVFGKQKRAFQHHWFAKYHWLDYNMQSDSVTCYVCKSQNQKENLFTERCKEEIFTKAGFRNWKKATEKFDKHQASQCHKSAITLEVTLPQYGDVAEMIDKNEKKSRESNRRCFMVILETLQYLARQGLAMRGDDDEESNFHQLLKLRSKSFPELKTWLSKKTDKFTSHEVQTEILTLMSHQVIRNLLDPIRSNFYSIMCDEYTDISNKEQLTFCIRWVNDHLEVSEKFLGFYEIVNISSAVIVAAIKDILMRYKLSLDMCRGQCYDGASNMLGKSSGVAARIFSLQPRAHYTHCHAHSLSLSVKDVTKSVKTLRDTMGCVQEIVILIKYSPKRETILGNLKEQIECQDDNIYQTNGILKLSETRWTVRAACFKRIIDNYGLLLDVWEHCLQNEKLKPDLKARIIGVKKQMESFDLFFGIHIGHRIYSHTDNLSKALQHQKMSACSSKRLAEMTQNVLENLRNEETFDLFYDAVIKKAKLHSFIKEPVKPRKRKAPNYSILYFVDGQKGSHEEPYYPQTSRDHYRVIFYEAIDSITSSMKDRFTQPSFVAYEKMESLLLKSINLEDTRDEIKYLKELYGGELDMEQFATEVDVLRVIFNDIKPDCFDDFLNHIKQFPSPQLALIPNTFIICKLLLVNPATTATAERSFSTARRIKTWMRSSMLPARFNALAILHSHKQFTDELILTDIANEFSDKCNRRLIFGRF